MKFTRALGLVMTLFLLASPLTAWAQEEPQWTEFVSTDGALTLSYPEGWFLVENGADVGLPGVQISNSEGALVNSEALKVGELGIIVLLLPQDILPLLGIELPAEGESMTPEDLVSKIASIFIISSETTSDAPGEMTPVPTPELGEPTTVDLSDDVTAGYMTLKGDDGEGVVIAYEQNGVIVLIVSASAAGGYTEEFDATTLAVAGSIMYTGTAAELMQFMMGGAVEGEATGTSVGEPTLEPDIALTATPVSP
jgi:hypothetical protein